jgi:hypothetical protein
MSTNEYGEITNYDEMMQAHIKAYNADPEGYEKTYNQFIEDMQRYEKTLALVEELKAQAIEDEAEIFSKNLEYISTEYELEVRLSDNSLKIIEH